MEKESSTSSRKLTQEVGEDLSTLSANFTSLHLWHKDYWCTIRRLQVEWISQQWDKFVLNVNTALLLPSQQSWKHLRVVDWAWAQTKLQSSQGCSLVPTESIKGCSERGNSHNCIKKKYFYLAFKSYVYYNKMSHTQKQQLWCDKIISFNSLGFLF